MKKGKGYLIYLPIELIKKVDQTRGDIPRSKWICRAIEKKLGVNKENSVVLSNNIPLKDISNNEWLEEMISKKLLTHKDEYGSLLSIDDWAIANSINDKLQSHGFTPNDLIKRWNEIMEIKKFERDIAHKEWEEERAKKRKEKELGTTEG